MDGEQVQVPQCTSKNKDNVDVEAFIKQQIIFNKETLVTEILNDTINKAFQLSQKEKCEVCPSRFSNRGYLLRHWLTFQNTFSPSSKKPKKLNPPVIIRYHISILPKPPSGG